MMFYMIIICGFLLFVAIAEFFVLLKYNGRIAGLINRARNYKKEHGMYRFVRHTVGYVLRKLKVRKSKIDASVKIKNNLLYGKRRAIININNSVFAGDIDTFFSSHLDENNLNICFLLNGGIGDFVILANYIYKFRQKYSCGNIKIDAIVSRNFEAAKSVFGKDIVDNIFLMEHDAIFSQNIGKNYDLFIDICRYPKVTNANRDKIKKYQAALLDYILTVEKQKIMTPRFYTGPRYDGQTSMYSNLHSIKRIQQADIEKFLDITEDYEYKIPIPIDSDEILKKFSLFEKKYIIFVSGADYARGVITSNKVWPNLYYDRLCEKIKEEFPCITLVQAGSDMDAYEFKNIDINLMGKTSFEETKVLIKNAWLLIGNEGGMVHLRHALCAGKSIVLFGPTDEKVFGYTENINIRGEGCPYPCEWFNEQWQTRCANKNRYACMWSISPLLVMEKLRNFIEKAK